MTRINCIMPGALSTKHLVAEYRELPRIFSLAIDAYHDRAEEHDDPRNPTSYVLGTGHCRFFYNKLAYLRDRYVMLCDEMHIRGYVVNFPRPTGLVDAEKYLPGCWWGNWEPDYDARFLNRSRLHERDPDFYPQPVYVAVGDQNNG